MSEVVINELPEGWELVQLQDVCNKITDGTHKTPKYQDKGVRFISIKNIKPFKPVNWDSYEKYISQEEHEELIKRCKPEYDDIVFPRIGTLGYAKRIDFKEEVSLFVGLGLLKPIKEVINPKYLEYWMNHPLIYKLSHQRATGSGRLTLALAESKKLPVPLAPYEQQKRIVTKIEELFSHIDAGIEALKKAKQLLKQYRQSVLKAAVTGELTKAWREANKDKLEPASQLLDRILETRRQLWEEQQLEQFKAKGKMPNDDKWKEKYKELSSISDDELNSFLELPENWLYTRLGNVIEEPKYGTSKKCTYDSSGTGVLRIPNIADSVIDSEDLKYAVFDKTEKETYQLSEGDILIIRSNGSIKIVGKCALIDDKDIDYLYAGYLIRLRPSSGIITGGYLINCLSSIYLRNQIEFKAKSTSGVNNINSGEIQSLVVAMCSKEEQIEVNKLVESRLTSISRLEKDINIQLLKAEKNKQSILASAFTGKM